MKKERDSQRLGSAPLGRLMVSLAVPAVAAQLINVLYNIVDRIYIGHIQGYGDVALTGVGVTFPIIMLISAFSAFAGMGGAPLASIALGSGLAGHPQGRVDFGKLGWYDCPVFCFAHSGFLHIQKAGPVCIRR